VLNEGADVRSTEGVLVRVTHPAKTVADCFKCRRQVGTAVAVEGLRECWPQRKVTMDGIHRCAKIDRVASVIRPNPVVSEGLW
jgi:predicted transcriptional regulator of viral defense system